MRLTQITLICSLLLSITPLARALPPVQPDSAMANIKTLTDPDLFHGRKSGTPQGNESQFWVAERFAAWGLNPLIGDSLLLPYSQLATEEKKGEISLLDSRYGEIDFLLGDDYTLCTNSGSADVTAPVTVVGYGIDRPEKGWNDYDHVDLTGRIAVITRGTPHNGEQWQEEFSRTYLYPEAVRHGAVAVLFYQGEDPVNGAAIQAEAYNPDVPAGYISKRMLDQLLFGSGYTTDSYKRELANGPLPVEVDRRLHIVTDVPRIPDAVGYNVVGVVPGTDPELSKEAVVVGGHGDHVGPNALGIVYPGADDNGSGAGTVMELARAFALDPQPRTLVFCIFGGEEQGLLGSEALAPILPDTYSYITMVNLDMVGRGEGKTGFGGGDQVWEMWDPWYDSLPDSIRKNIEARRAWGGNSSDHAPFRDQGIPAFTGYSRGHHDFYHSADDRFYTIQRPAIAGAVTSAARWISQAASYKEPMADRHLAARTIWHQGTPLVWFKATGEAALDLDLAKRSRESGFMGSVFRLEAPEDRAASRTLLDRLISYRETIDNESHLAGGNALKDMRGNAYSLRQTVYFALEADPIANADTTRLETWSEFGLHWLILDEPEDWTYGGGVAKEKAALMPVIKRVGGVVQMPLDDAPEFMPVARSVGSSALFVGSRKDFEALPDTTLEEVRDTGAGILLLAGRRDLKALSQAQDRLAHFKVQVQPEGENYEDALKWVERARELNIDQGVLVDWIGGNMPETP